MIGSTFADLSSIISQIHDKSRIGVCLDTCHLHAAGYDLRTPSAFRATLREFDTVVGMRYLRALHLNDCKAPLGSGRDLHANVGTGFLGLRAFWNVVNERACWGLPMVLETPIEVAVNEGENDGLVSEGEEGMEKSGKISKAAKASMKPKPKPKMVEDKGIWAREIKLLESLVGMDAESEEFKTLEKELADRGAAERAKYQEAFERKLEKERKVREKMEAGGGGVKRKGKRMKVVEEDDDDDDEDEDEDEESGGSGGSGSGSG